MSPGLLYLHRCGIIEEFVFIIIPAAMWVWPELVPKLEVNGLLKFRLEDDMDVYIDWGIPDASLAPLLVEIPVLPFLPQPKN